MTKGYIIEEIRTSVRLRDSASGKTVDVPLKTGGPWSPPPARSGSTATPSEPSKAEERSAGSDGATVKREPTTRANVSDARVKAGGEGKRRSADKGKSDRAENPGARRASRAAEKARPGEPSSTAAQEARGRVEQRGLSAEDAEAWKNLQANLRHVRSQQGGKKGGLGWKETTDAGRSGLLARSGSGAYKILHAGSDTYGLFYEWDNGSFERIACGKADHLMNLATEKARSGPPPVPPTRLSLELARLVCGNTEQAVTAVDPEPTPEPEKRARRVVEAANDDVTTPRAAEVAVDPELDEQLMASLKKALAELED